MLRYHCDRETLCLSQLNYPIQGGFHHVILGGNNTLRLLVLSSDQKRILRDTSLLAPRSKININTIKTCDNLIGCGLTSGAIIVYGTQPSGKTTQFLRLNDHKRCVNSLDFADSNLLISGTQDGTIKLWDLRAPGSRASVTLFSGPHADPVRACQHSPHAPARNKLTILSVHDSGALHKYDLRVSHQPVRRWNFHTGPALSLSIHPTAEYVLTGSRDHKVCVCSYNEPGSMPEITVNTLGPVMKVRWSPYESEAEPSIQLESDTSSSLTDELYRYDFACSFLNEVPTIAVYNPRRKYIPRELVSSLSDRPFHNFLWAQNPEGNRCIWTLTKANVFAAHDLRNSPNVAVPLDHMLATEMAWSAKDFLFVSNRRSDFEGPNVHHSPIVHPVLLPIHTQQQLMAENYLYSPPDGFDIAAVCDFNAHVASSAGQLRDAHTWQVIGAAISSEATETAPEVSPVIADESQSSDTELNFGNSSLTLTTHYGGLLGPSRSDAGILKSASLGNLIDLIKQHRKSSMSLSESPAKRDSFSKSIRPHAESFSDFDLLLRKQASMPHIREELGEEKKKEGSMSMLSTSTPAPTYHLGRSSTNGIPETPKETDDTNKDPASKIDDDQQARPTDSQLESNSLSAFRSQPSQRGARSQLSKVLSDQHQERLEPWQPKQLVTSALNYAIEQGNIVLGCALTLLFYDHYKHQDGFETRACNERIALYLSVLEQWRLFTVALTVLNLVPLELDDLRALKEVDLRFFCSFCSKVILNENKTKHDFGYWYCDLCARQQPNCIYCHEPCHGLNVVRSLKCGHRGHFGCLKQWFVVEGNLECPGGCLE